MVEIGTNISPLFFLHIELVLKLPLESCLFFTLFYRFSCLPTESVLSPIPNQNHVDVEDYKVMLTQKLSKAWELAQQNVKKAQHHNKQMHDRGTQDNDIKVGD